MAYQLALAAMADPSRQEICQRLKAGPLAVGDIARGMTVSRPAVSQHLKILKAAGLVDDRPDGTRRLYYLEPAGLAPLVQWLNGFWDDALIEFKNEVERMGKEKT
jgi:DNA-binding transcriptional ArsR family regulator